MVFIMLLKWTYYILAGGFAKVQGKASRFRMISPLAFWKGEQVYGMLLMIPELCARTGYLWYG